MTRTEWAVAVIRTRGAGGHDREHIADHAPRMCGVEN